MLGRVKFGRHFAQRGIYFMNEIFIWYWRRMENIKWPEKVTNEEVLECIGEKRTLLNNIPRRKANWTGHILRRNCLLASFMIPLKDRRRKRKE